MQYVSHGKLCVRMTEGVWELSDSLLNCSVKLKLLLKFSLFKNMCILLITFEKISLKPDI